MHLKLLQTEDIDFSLSDENMWLNIFLIKNSLNEFKYPNLTKIVKLCLTLSHGQADVERVFSISKWIISEEMTSTSLKMLNNRLYIRSIWRNYNYDM